MVWSRWSNYFFFPVATIFCMPKGLDPEEVRRPQDQILTLFLLFLRWQSVLLQSLDLQEGREGKKAKFVLCLAPGRRGQRWWSLFCGIGASLLHVLQGEHFLDKGRRRSLLCQVLLHACALPPAPGASTVHAIKKRIQTIVACLAITHPFQTQSTPVQHPPVEGYKISLATCKLSTFHMADPSLLLGECTTFSSSSSSCTHLRSEFKPIEQTGKLSLDLCMDPDPETTGLPRLFQILKGNWTSDLQGVCCCSTDLSAMAHQKARGSQIDVCLEVTKRDKGHQETISGQPLESPLYFTYLLHSAKKEQNS